MSNSDNHPNVTGAAKLLALQAAGQFQDLGEYSTLPAFTAYAVEAAYDQLVMEEKAKPAPSPAGPVPFPAADPVLEAEEILLVSEVEETAVDSDEEEFEEPLLDGDDE